MNPLNAAVAPNRTSGHAAATATDYVVVVGLGYVGLPTCIGVAERFPVLGLDRDPERVSDITAGKVDVLPEDLASLRSLLDSERLKVTSDWANVGNALGVIVCVPTPVGPDLKPDPRCLEDACREVVDNAVVGQTIVLVSTTYVGSTRDLLVEPLRKRGFTPGEDIFVAFAPERLLPGTPDYRVPRVIGGATDECAKHAIDLIGTTAVGLHQVSSIETAEMSKLYENTFRAVNLALANELAAGCTHLGLDPTEVIEAAATKPYGFLPHFPSAGVGGHCIPVDPYYLLCPLELAGVEMPIMRRAMDSVSGRAREIAKRALELLRNRPDADDRPARVLVEGIAYKPGLRDTRHSPGADIGSQLSTLGGSSVGVVLHDPLIPGLDSPVEVSDLDLVILAMQHDGFDYSWLNEAVSVLDCTYRLGYGYLP